MIIKFISTMETQSLSVVQMPHAEGRFAIEWAKLATSMIQIDQIDAQTIFTTRTFYGRWKSLFDSLTRTAVPWVDASNTMTNSTRSTCPMRLRWWWEALCARPWLALFANTIIGRFTTTNQHRTVICFSFRWFLVAGPRGQKGFKPFLALWCQTHDDYLYLSVVP